MTFDNENAGDIRYFLFMRVNPDDHTGEGVLAIVRACIETGDLLDVTLAADRIVSASGRGRDLLEIVERDLLEAAVAAQVPILVGGRPGLAQQEHEKSSDEGR